MQSGNEKHTFCPQDVSWRIVSRRIPTSLERTTRERAQVSPPVSVHARAWQLPRLTRTHRLIRLRDDPYVRLRRLPPAGVLLRGLLVRNAAADDDVFAGFPVHRR